MRRLPALLAVLGWLPIPTAAAPQGSIEEYLRRVREEREAEFARLRQTVDDLAQRLGAARARDLERLHEQIAALGPEAAPLLVPYLDPGAPAAGAEAQDDLARRRQRAQEVAKALVRSGNPALLEDLLRLAREGSPEGRVLAVQVLGTSPERGRALSGLRELFASTSGALRVECVRSIARLDPAEPLVEGALGDPDVGVVRAALDALASVPHERTLPAVRALAADATRAAPVLRSLVSYYRAPGLQLDEEEVIALLRLAARNDLEPEARLAVVDALPHLGVALGSRLRREVEPLLESSDSALREATLVALTLLRDPRAKRELTRFYDDLVDDNPRWPQAFQRRGDMQLRIGEYRDAARDYQTAIELHGKSSRLPGNRDLWINLARAHVKDGKLRSAAEALEEFGLTSELRQELRADPDFAPLVEHSRYRKLFE